MTQKKKVRASTRAYDLFLGNTKFDPHFINMGDTAGNTLAKFSVHALINDPKKKVTGIN